MEIVDNQDYPFFEYDSALFQVRFLDEDEGTEVMKKSQFVEYDRKHQRQEKINYAKMNRLIVKKVLVGWKNLDLRAFKQLIIPTKTLQLSDGETWEDEVEYTPELRDFLVQYMHHEFMGFVVGAAKDVEAHQLAQNAIQAENLGLGSTGGKSTPISPANVEKSSGKNTKGVTA